MNLINSHYYIIFFISLGILECFWGYKIFKFTLALAGFIVGSGIITNLGYPFFYAIIGGLIGSVVAFSLYFVGVFFIGGLIGYLVGVLFLTQNFIKIPEIFILILFVIGGVLAIIFQKFMIVFSTSFGGAWSIILGTFYIFNPQFNVNNFQGLKYYLIISIWIILGVLGFVVQYKLIPNSEKERERDNLNKKFQK